MDDERRQDGKAFTSAMDALNEEQLGLFIGATMNHLQDLRLDVTGPQCF